jgi:hypothetical protein
VNAAGREPDLALDMELHSANWMLCACCENIFTYSAVPGNHKIVDRIAHCLFSNFGSCRAFDPWVFTVGCPVQLCAIHFAV